LKVRAAGYRNFWTPYAELYHHESASRGAEDTLEKRDRFRSEVEYMTARWGDALVNDPAYNPNLTLTINDFTLALPPRPWASRESPKSNSSARWAWPSRRRSKRSKQPWRCGSDLPEPCARTLTTLRRTRRSPPRRLPCGAGSGSTPRNRKWPRSKRGANPRC